MAACLSYVQWPFLGWYGMLRPCSQQETAGRRTRLATVQEEEEMAVTTLELGGMAGPAQVLPAILRILWRCML